MVSVPPCSSERRRFLKFLAASPILPYAALPGPWIDAFLTSRTSRSLTGPTLLRQLLAADDDIITAASEALNVMDFEAVARARLSPAHFGYLETGVDDDATLRANREGFARYHIRVRRLVDVRRIDASVRLLGTTWETPIALCPVGSQKAFHPDGESATARAAREKRHLQILSTQATTSVEDVNAARGEPVWYQLYARPDWNDTLRIIRRVEMAACPAIVFTIDLLGGTNRETLRRAERQDARDCSVCHEPGPRGAVRRKPMYDGLAMADLPEGQRSVFTWDYVRRLRDTTGLKLLLKGIVTREDAELAVEHGVDGIIVSNHGGRGEASGRATIASLPEVVEGVCGRVPVILDSGIRRGTDIFKAIALGADAIGIGRPYIWGLAGFGQEGVETVLDLLRRELQLVMRQAGTPTLRDITRAHLVDTRTV